MTSEILPIAWSLSHLSDPLIQKLLSDRQIDYDEISPADELERLNRMYTMLRSSKKYRKLATQQANDRWADESFDILETMNQDTNSSYRRSSMSVSFRDTIEIIPSEPIFHQKTIFQKIKKAFTRRN